jgi:hypothetical protein
MTRMLRVVTWNVLHRVHGVNWKEPQIAAFPEERVRSLGIADRVSAWLAAGVSAVCLQEVSGDQLAVLRERVGEVEIFEHRYPRLPRIRGGGGPVLVDASEHLVTLTRTSASAGAVTSHTFAEDPGKGMIVVEIAGALLVNTHVSFGGNGELQLGRLAEAARDVDHAVIVGDFNAPAAALQRAFGTSFVLSELGAATRVATLEHSGRTIDHVAVRGGKIVMARVEEGGGLSDHEPVFAEIALELEKS